CCISSYSRPRCRTVREESPGCARRSTPREVISKTRERAPARDARIQMTKSTHLHTGGMQRTHFPAIDSATRRKHAAAGPGRTSRDGGVVTASGRALRRTWQLSLLLAVLLP